jgi:plasmid stabilization system protein ParE
MNHSLIFSEGAQQDIIESILWYNEQKENLGFEFYDHLTQKLSLLSSTLLHYSTRYKNVRAANLDKYPFLIYFTIDDRNSLILILGILHTSRDSKIISKRK